jgi:hypothetical protein
MRWITRLTRSRQSSGAPCARTSPPLPAKEHRRLPYFSTPAEAFAEFFAERYDPNYTADGEAGLDRLKRARRVVNEEIDRLEDCRQKFR